MAFALYAVICCCIFTSSILTVAHLCAAHNGMESESGREGREEEMEKRQRAYIFPFQLLFIVMIFLAPNSASDEVSCLVSMYRTGSTMLREGEEKERLKEREREREKRGAGVEPAVAVTRTKQIQERERDDGGGGGASSCCHTHKTNSSDSILAF